MADDRIRVDSNEPAASQADQDKAEQVREFLRVARERWRTVVTAESDLRKEMMHDLEFRASDQWDPVIRKMREDDGRPCISINRLPQFIRQVTNAQRSSNLAVKVSGVDDGADIETAEVIQGLIRHIEQQSDAAVAYGTAGEHQATMGRGYWRVITEYEGPRSFVQTIRIKRVRNPFSVFVDPSSQEADGSDARYAFVVEDIPRPEFKSRYGDKAMASLVEFEATELGRSSEDWMPEGSVKVAEYWYVESKRVEIYLVEFKDGTQVVMDEDEYQAIPDEIREQNQPKVINNRTAEIRQVKQAIISAADILEGNPEKTAGRDWPGQWIPIVPVIGDEIDINGKLDLRGMVRDAKEPQRLYNIQNSVLAETLAQVPRAPWIGYEGQFEGHESEWQQANRKAYAYLEVKAKSLDGVHPLPLPQRVSAAADISSLMVAIQQSDQDLKATMGLYEPSLGIRQTSGQSGKAIEALKKQGEQANSNFLDNMSRSIRFTGRILIDLIPKIYDAARVVRIIGTDEVEKAVMVHAGQAPPAMEMAKGVDGVYDLSVGKFDVVVNAGPSLETKRAEAFEALNAFVQAYPAAFPVLGDLLVGNLDWPGAKAAAERLKRLLPPQAVGPEGEGAEDIPPHVQAQIQQMAAQMEALAAELQAAQQEIQSKTAAVKVKSEADIQIAQIRADVEMAKEQAKAQSAAMLETLKGEIERMLQRFEHAHDRAMAAQARVDDRQDMAEGRFNDRVDTVAGRQMDRDDAMRTRQLDREDSTTERRENRKDAETEAARASGRPVPKDLTLAE